MFCIAQPYYLDCGLIPDPNVAIKRKLMTYDVV